MQPPLNHPYFIHIKWIDGLPKIVRRIDIVAVIDNCKILLKIMELPPPILRETTEGTNALETANDANGKTRQPKLTIYSLCLPGDLPHHAAGHPRLHGGGFNQYSGNQVNQVQKLWIVC